MVNKMEIAKKSYGLLISQSEKLIFNIGTKVQMLEINNEQVNEIKNFDLLKNISHIAISSNEKLIAYKNTGGHIVVQELETGNMLIKSKCLSKEGYSIYFTNEDKTILSSEWGGKVYEMDICSGNVQVIYDLPITSTNLIKIRENEFIAFGKGEGKYSEVYKLFLDAKTVKHISLFQKFWLEEVNAIINEGIIYFYSAINYDECKQVVMLDSTNETISTLVVSEIDKYPYSYYTCMCLSNNKRYLLLGFSSSIYVFDTSLKKLIGMKNIKYISSVNFIFNDKKVLIGTWSKIFVINFSELLF